MGTIRSMSNENSGNVGGVSLVASALDCHSHCWESSMSMISERMLPELCKRVPYIFPGLAEILTYIHKSVVYDHKP